VAAAIPPGVKQDWEAPEPTGSCSSRPRTASWTVPGPAPEAEFHVIAVLVVNRTFVTSLGTTSVTPPQTPPVQLSFPVQALPSLQVVPLGAFGFEQRPVAGEQVPAT